MDITRDIQPMTAFRNHSAAFMRHLRTTKRPLILTVNANVAEGIRQGLDDVAGGRSRAAHEVFGEIRAEHGIPR